MPIRVTWAASRILAFLHWYAGAVLDDESGTEACRFAGAAAHVLSCGPCAGDYRGSFLATRSWPT